MPWSQRIKTLLFPVTGLDLEPGQPESEIRIEGDVQPTLALLVGKGPRGAVWVEATQDGSLKSATTGSGLESYEIFTGSSANAYVAMAQTITAAHVDIQVVTEEQTVRFKDAGGSWLGDIPLSVGWHSWDFSFAGVAVKSTAAGVHGTYKILVMG